ncbi:MAG: radical SAM protein, partial [Oscillospiraceae bacterium]|nr:radical SAM protein [Oscillospiraceae bacterium]
MMTQTKTGLRVVRVQRSCVHDGPGLRTTIFFRGCALRCQWCQNPESLAPAAQPGDENLTAEGIAEIVLRDAKYYRATGGGVTLSGGEPFLQDADSLLELLAALKEEDIPVAAETSLCAPWENIEALLPYISLFVADLKAVDGALHKELTGRDNALIRSNLEKLVGLGAPVRLRTLVVPGLNDGEAQIEAMAGYVKSLGFDTIELMRYHNMYEDKAKQLGLEVPMLGITGERSLRALKAGTALFKKYGVEARSDDLADKPPAARFTRRVLDVQAAIREAPRSICFEVSRLKTEYYKEFDGFSKPVHIHRAERLRHVLRNKKTIVYPGELLVGNFTGKRVAGQIWEEQYGALYALFIGQAHRQTPVKFYSDRSERMNYYFNVFPYWLPKGTIMRGGGDLKNIFLTLSRVAETSTGFNNNFAAIAHFVVNFDRILKLGTLGLKAEAEAKAREHPENNQDFYKGVVVSLQALEDWAERYAAHLWKLAGSESDANRKDELEKMAKVCARVPKYPARTFHEALQSMMFLQLALCIEAYENAVSFGRIDQILYPYFRADLEAGRITCDEAKELLCLFVLKMDEVILVNDGDGVLNISKLFETLSVDQALTFGGVDRDGEDAVNDVTYMCIDACELQPLAINMCARIHEKNPQRYLDRLAEIYINGCPMPEMFGDEVYIESLQRHYPDTGIENARNYSIVGCVEPVASDDHFGNTDSANMNLALPLLQALKGHEHDLWNFPFNQQFEKMGTRMIEFFLPRFKEKREKHLVKHDRRRGMYDYDPPKDMDELLARFKARLNALAKSILSDQQDIEEALSKYYTTPLASSLYKGCLKNAKDAYE